MSNRYDSNWFLFLYLFISYSDLAFETQMFHGYGLNFICILDKICAFANAACHNLIQVKKFKST